MEKIGQKLLIPGSENEQEPSTEPSINKYTTNHQLKPSVNIKISAKSGAI
jgi:hypothetical protein